MHMSAAALETIVQQIEQLAPEEKWTLLSLLIESLRRQAGLGQPCPQSADLQIRSLLIESLHRRAGSARRRLCDYYGVGKGRGFRTAQEVDAFIEEERASWER